MLQGAGPKGGGHLPQPLLQPFRKSHPAPLRQVDALVDVDVLAELRGQLLLGAGVEVAESGDAVNFLLSFDEFCQDRLPGFIKRLCKLAFKTGTRSVACSNSELGTMSCTLGAILP